MESAIIDQKGEGYMQIILQTFVMIISLCGAMFGMQKFLLKDIHRDLCEIRKDISRIESRMDKADIRIDHLYEICIDLLKERNI